MNITSKIKNARINANLTQEQAALALNVSRQTISNWETGRTYPDILSVVKMSDLYKISLDSLLKDSCTPSDYTEYLSESTNAVKSKNRLSKIVLLSVYLTIWAISLIAFWIFNAGSDAMGYSIMYLWIVLPAVTFIVSAVIGKNNYWGRQKWLICILSGIMYMLAEYATFSAANMASFNKFNMPQFEMIISGAVIAVLGMAAGTLIRYISNRKENKT